MALADHTTESRAQLAAVEAFKRDLSQEAIDRILNDQDQLRSLAEALLAEAMPRLAKAGRNHTDDLVTLNPQEEVVTKNYLTEGSSHKAALRTAKKEAPQPFDPERWAEDQF